MNGEAQETHFKRYDSPYVQADYLSEDLMITAEGHTHRINVRAGVRESH